MAWWRPEEEASPQSRVGAKHRPADAGAPVDPAQPSSTARPAEQPVELPWPSQEQPPAYQHPPLPRRFPISVPMAVVALLFVGVFVVPFIFAFGAFTGEDGINGGFESPSSHEGPSMVPAKRFGRAMEKVREEAGAEASLTVLRVAPDRIDATVRKAGGDQVLIQVLPDLTVRRFSAGSNSRAGLSLRKVGSAVPQRLVGAGAERLRVSRKELDYLALTSIPNLGGGGIWSVFFAGGGAGRYVVADLDGRNLRVPGQ